MDSFNRRSALVLIGLGILGALVLGQLLSFQLRLSPSLQDFQVAASERGVVMQQVRPTRGEIYDRDGVALAVNSFEYRVGLSPALVYDRRKAATDIARILNLNEVELFNQMQPDANGVFRPYILLASPISNTAARDLEDLRINGLLVETIPLRRYPQGALVSQLTGFVNYSEQGFYGIEGRYDRLLAGTAREFEGGRGLLNVSDVPEARDGVSLVLTIDRDVQFVISEALAKTINPVSGPFGGTIIVMNPRTGEILGMQSWPMLSSEEFLRQANPGSFNPAISDVLEPGSIMKVVTAAIALQANHPGLDLNWSYNSTGCYVAAGVRICDSDRVARGLVSFSRCITESLNTCTSTWYGIIGPSKVYPLLEDFGFGRATGIDLEGEEAGLVNKPGDALWSEAGFLNVSYGQGIAVTPLQILTATNAVANGGLLMQPHIVRERIDGDQRFRTVPNVVRRPISAEVAQVVTDLLVDVVAPGEFGYLAYMDDYTLAGKTGTAQQPIPGGYSNTATWGSFIGYLPADDPMVSMVIILDRPPEYWGSLSAAPLFKEIMDRLVVILEIPPDNIRFQLMAEGARPFERINH